MERCRRLVFRRRALAYAALCVVCAGAWTTVHAASAGGIVVRHAWMRPATAGAPAAPLYLEIVSDRWRRLVEITSPAAASVAIVDPAATDDRTTKTTVVLDPRVLIRFTPGRRHLELRNVSGAINKGNKVPLSLTFVAANDVKTSMTVYVQVRAPLAPGSG